MNLIFRVPNQVFKEDHVIAMLTWRQVFYLTLTIALCLSGYLAAGAGRTGSLLATVVLFAGVTFTLGRIEGENIDSFLSSLILFWRRPRAMAWLRRASKYQVSTGCKGGRHKGTPESSQLMVDVLGFRDGVILLRNGECRTILKVSSINFDLKSLDEQSAILYAFQKFLNSLAFPVQVCAVARLIDVSGYLKRLEDRMTGVSELIRRCGQDYLRFLASLVQERHVLTRDYYLVLPWQPTLYGSPKGYDLASESQAERQATLTSAASQLSSRRVELEKELKLLGLEVRTLSVTEIADLLYSSYNRHIGEKVRVHLDPRDLETTAVSGPLAVHAADPLSNPNSARAGGKGEID